MSAVTLKAIPGKARAPTRVQFCTSSRILTVFLLWLISIVVAPITQAAESLTISPTVSTSVLKSPLSEDSLTWSRNKKVLTLGVSSENFEPYEIIQGQSLKGIVADYFYLISQHLQIETRVRVYPDWSSALQALTNGEVDVLGRGLVDFDLAGLSPSAPYQLNTPVIAGRTAELEFSKIKVQGKIAFAGDFVSAAQIADRFLVSSTTKYNSVLDALHAVEYQKQNWFIGDPIVMGYYQNKGELNHLREYPLYNWKKSGYSFLFRKDANKIRAAFNEVLENIKTNQKEKIADYWSASARIERPFRAVFNDEEKAWLSTHPEVRVAINGALPPYSFYDEAGELRGVVIDMLSEISQNVGINFKIVDTASLGELEKSLREKNSDMAFTILPNRQRESYLKFTEPYLYNSFALVTQNDSPLDSLSAFHDKKIAIQRSNYVADKILQNYPTIKLVKKDSQLDSLVAVANGEVDAAVGLLPSATYLIRQYFSEDLKVATSLPDFQANLPIAVATEQAQLYNVMTKVIEQLGPNYINGLFNSWKAVPPAKASIWKEYINSFRALSAVAIIGAALLCCLIVYLFVKRKRMLLETTRFEFRSALLDSIPMAISVRDLDGRFVFCNQVFYSQLRLLPEQVIGTRTSEFIGLDSQQAAEHQRLYFQTLKDGVADQRQLDATVNGVHLTFRQWDRPYTDKKGNIAGLISGYADMTSNVLLLQQLRDSHDQAVEANEAKSRFLAVMSHEIRTPLNAIIGLLELTLQRMDRGHTWDREDLEVAYGSSKSLIELIDDILDLAKIESGNVTLMNQRCNLSEVIQSVSRVFSGVARQKGLQLKLEENFGSAGDISIDAGRFKQILSNILSNAIKFTDSGGVTINVLSETNNTGGIHIALTISDTGIGISDEDQAKLFQPFSQASTPANSRGGTGLGLVICRQLIEMMGGTLTMQSAPGSGTRVTIDLTAAALGPEPSVPNRPLQESPQPKPRLNVLLVDDHPANRLLLGQQLEFLGHTVEEAEDGLQAFTRLKQKAFDLVITDCSMPVMDGYELSQQWRTFERENEQPSCWIVGFTANAQVEEHARCLEAGMDECLFKPVSLAQLQVCIDNLHPRASSNVQLASKETITQAPLIDRASINGLTNGNEKLIKMLLTQLHTSNELDLQQLNLMVRDEKWKEMSLLAHRLKGVARLINAKPLIDATHAYEEEFNNQSTEAKLKSLAKHIASILEELQAELFQQLKITQHSITNS